TRASRPPSRLAPASGPPSAPGMPVAQPSPPSETRIGIAQRRTRTSSASIEPRAGFARQRGLPRRTSFGALARVPVEVTARFRESMGMRRALLPIVLLLAPAGCRPGGSSPFRNAGDAEVVVCGADTDGDGIDDVHEG